MPRQPKAPIALEDRFAKRIDDALERDAPALAARLGPPPGSDRFTRRERDALWDTRDPAVHRDALYQALQAGLSAEDTDRIALFRMAPELAKLVTATPLPPDQAAVVAQLAEYPGRYVLTAAHSGDPEQQIKFVEDEHARAAKRQAQMSEPASEPHPSAPSMGGY